MVVCQIDTGLDLLLGDVVLQAHIPIVLQAHIPIVHQAHIPVVLQAHIPIVLQVLGVLIVLQEGILADARRAQEGVLLRDMVNRGTDTRKHTLKIGMEGILTMMTRDICMMRHALETRVAGVLDMMTRGTSMSRHIQGNVLPILMMRVSRQLRLQQQAPKSTIQLLISQSLLTRLIF
nr:uncharacterized protein LOC129264605 [Lytechinus pictus]